MIKQIGLQASTDDFEKLYKGIFEAVQTGSFVLKNEVAVSIVNLNCSVEVYFLNVGNIEFELFHS